MEASSAPVFFVPVVILLLIAVIALTALAPAHVRRTVLWVVGGLATTVVMLGVVFWSWRDGERVDVEQHARMQANEATTESQLRAEPADSAQSSSEDAQDLQDGSPAQAEAEAAPEPLPAWVERGTYRDGETTWLVLDTELPYATPSAARDDLEEQARDELLGYFGERNVAYDERDMGAAIDAAMQELNIEEVVGTGYDGFAAGLRMFRGYALVELSPRVAAIAHERAIDRRLAYVGGGAAAVLVVLIVALGYLKLDDATRGYYSGRLKLGAVAVLVAAGAGIWSVVQSLAG